MAGEGDALLLDLPQGGQGEDLEAAGVREDGAVPADEFMEASHLPHHLVARAQVEVIGVGELDLAAHLLQIVGADAALDGPLGADIHEDGGLHRAAVGALELTPPGLPLSFDDFEHDL